VTSDDLPIRSRISVVSSVIRRAVPVVS